MHHLLHGDNDDFFLSVPCLRLPCNILSPIKMETANQYITITIPHKNILSLRQVRKQESLLQVAMKTTSCRYHQ